MQLYDYDFCKESSQKHCKVGVEIQGKAEQGSQKIYRCEPDSCVTLLEKDESSRRVVRQSSDD